MRLFVLAVALFLPLVGAGADLGAGWKAALDKIAPKSLEAHVSFLASDALQGRDTSLSG